MNETRTGCDQGAGRDDDDAGRDRDRDRDLLARRRWAADLYRTARGLVATADRIGAASFGPAEDHPEWAAMCYLACVCGDFIALADAHIDACEGADRDDDDDDYGYDDAAGADAGAAVKQQLDAAYARAQEEVRAPATEQPPDQDQEPTPQESFEADIYLLAWELIPAISDAALAQALVNSLLRFARPTPEWVALIDDASRRLADWLAENNHDHHDGKEG
jgi:hypothetical protein